MFIGHLQVAFSGYVGLLPIHAQTTCKGYSAVNSVSRVARKFWNNLGQGATPARRMIR